ncbi:MAG: hypothetical protein A2Z34_12075 [Planctomycetes bacterium RBG_16_59_8]|nr:MAG: hypothetical protein A2Z34_12075 [Planctomycetes bacterium RBG_16_59_8]
MRMTKKCTMTGLVAFLLVAVVGSHHDDVREGMAKQLLIRYPSVKTTARAIGDESKAKVEKASGRKLDLPGGNVEVFEAGDAIAAFSELKENGKSIFVGVAISPQKKMILSAQAFDESGKVLSSYAPFFVQFARMPYGNPLVFYVPTERLKSLIEKSEGKEKEAGDLKAVIKMYGAMRMTDFLWPMIKNEAGRNEKGAAAKATDLAAIIGGLADIAGGATFLDAAQARQMKDSAVKTQAGLEQLAKMIDGGQFDDAKKLIKDFRPTRCDQCHAACEKIFYKKAYATGMSAAYFYVGHDVLPLAGEKGELSQNLADAVKKTILLLLEAK